MRTKEIQGKLWSTAPADWAQFQEPHFIPLYDHVLHQLKLDEEKSLLDVGCGAGLFLSMAARTGAKLHGVDAAPGLLVVSRRRLPGITLLTEDLEALPFADETFDVVTGFNSFQYAGSFRNALVEARRVVKNRAKVVIAIWGREELCDAGTIMKEVSALLPAPPPGTPGPFALSVDGKIENICIEVGLNVIRRHEVFCPWQFNCNEDLLDAFMCTAPCVTASEFAGHDAVKNRILRSARPFDLADEVYYLKNYFTFFITERI